MKHLELTEQKAKDLNELCQFAVDFTAKIDRSSNNFDITYYQRQKPHYEIDYLRHLLDVAKQFENVNKLLNIDGTRSVWATHNTKEFLKTGGFLRILKIEQREDKIQDFTLRNLRQSIFATKDWWIFFTFSTIVTILVAITTTLSTNRLSQKNSQPMTSQDSLLQSLATYILTRDTFHHLPVDTASNLSSYKNNFKNLQINTTQLLIDTTH